MQIILAEKAGFCFGVNRAVNMAYDLSKSGKKGCTLGQLIHNKDVTDDLEKSGVRAINSIDEAKSNETIIIRAHGVPKSVYEELERKNQLYIDATCPFVKKIHSIVSEQSSDNIPVLIAGDSTHPEVRGIMGHCKGKAFTFNSVTELEKIFESNKKLLEIPIIVVSQTTFSVEEWKKSKIFLKKYCTNAKIFDTICFATKERQDEAANLAQMCDAMIVIGGRHSSNTVKLYSVCREKCDTYLVERADELINIDLSTYAKVGITAGASTPEEIIKEVLSNVGSNQ